MNLSSMVKNPKVVQSGPGGGGHPVVAAVFKIVVPPVGGRWVRLPSIPVDCAISISKSLLPP